MKKTLIIAEKSELAKAIEGALENQENYYITYTGGHALTFLEPEEIDEKYKEWKIEDLPIYFKNWPQKIIKGKEERVKGIGEALKTCSMVINAGDVDDEGQFLVDEILNYFGYQGEVKRLNTSNTTKEGLKKALANMEDNAGHVNFGLAAYARAVSDKTFGYSLSRYFSIANRRKLSVGRVQTPTLGLVVNRDLAVEGHNKSFYYDLKAEIDNGAEIKNIVTKLVLPKDSDLLTEGLVTEEKTLKEISEKIKGGEFKTTVTKKPVTENPPLPFNLVNLQSYCGKSFGYSPKDVMEITQSLRDNHKAITYNRSDCQYLTTDNYNEAPAVIESTIASLGIDLDADPSIKSKAFNDENVSAHYAIIPSGQQIALSNLNQKERDVYEIIAKYYLAQFLPSAEKEKTEIQVVLPEEGHMLKGSSVKLISPGFLGYLKGQTEDEEKESPLSNISPGEYNVTVMSTEIEKGETRPPKRYTQSSLVKDMTQIAKYIKNEDIKKLLKEKDKDKKGENGSIGTPATRDSIIEALMKRGFLEEKDGKGKEKTLVSTALGREFFGILPEEIRSAETTASWWVYQEDISMGNKTVEALINSVLDTVRGITDKAPEAALAAEVREIVGICPKCKKDVYEGKSTFYCQDRECEFFINKNDLFFVSKKKKVTKELVEKLLKGKTLVKGLYSEKSGKKYDATISIDDASGKFIKWKMEFSQKKKTKTERKW